MPRLQIGKPRKSPYLRAFFNVAFAENVIAKLTICLQTRNTILKYVRYNRNRKGKAIPNETDISN